MAFVLGEDTIESSTLRGEVPASLRGRFERLIQRRIAGEPVAMIVGKTEFKGLELEVRRNTFVPRNSSELLADEAIRRLRGRRRPVAVDVCTGTGPVALAIANDLPKARVWGVDIWGPALSVARRNAERLRIRNATFLRSDMLNALPASLRGGTDTFTIHPPYVARQEVGTLSTEIRKFEPAPSLTDGSDDGLGLVRRLVDDAPEWLAPGGWILVEVSPNLSRKVRGILQRAGYRRVRSHRDSLGATRVVGGSLPR